MPETPDDKRLARHARYNASAKGQARNKRYEDAHPERKERWSPLMRIKAYPNRGADATPDN